MPDDPRIDRRTLPRQKTGKSSNPDWSLSGVLTRREVKLAVQRRLLDLGGKEDFSDLINRLLVDWLGTQGVILPPAGASPPPGTPPEPSSKKAATGGR